MKNSTHFGFRTRLLSMLNVLRRINFVSAVSFCKLKNLPRVRSLRVGSGSMLFCWTFDNLSRQKCLFSHLFISSTFRKMSKIFTDLNFASSFFPELFCRLLTNCFDSSCWDFHRTGSHWPTWVLLTLTCYSSGVVEATQLRFQNKQQLCNWF